VRGAEKLLLGEVTVLDLGACRIGDDGAAIVAAFLKDDDTLEVIWLSFCSMGPRGAMTIADAMKQNKTVRFLDLGGNRLGEEGGRAFIQAFNYNVCIVWLNVPNNNIAPESMATIKYLTETRNRILIPAAVRRASLYLIAARRTTPIANAGILAILRLSK
jgi:hypothetical protein